jgi:predicted metal-dependent hydrolase
LTGPSDFAVRVADRDIPVAVLRHPNARRLRLRYDAKIGQLRLTMPPRGSMASARDWVAAQHGWIAQQLENAPEYPVVTTGTVMPYRGHDVTITWRADAPRMPAHQGDQLMIGGPQAAIGRRVARWIAAEARIALSDATTALAATADLPLSAVSVGDPRSRWGSCSASGRIRYSWRLMMMPDFVRDSVIAHEVAHLRHLDHSARFHRLAADLLGADPGVARVWLQRHGSAILRWQFL